MGTNEKINDLQVRKEKIEAGGGADRITKQHETGKLTARERIEKLFDSHVRHFTFTVTIHERKKYFACTFET